MATQVITYKVGSIMANGAKVLEVDAKGQPVVVEKPKNGNGQDGLVGKSPIQSAKEAKVDKQAKATVNAAAVREKVAAAKATVVPKTPAFQGDAELVKAHAKLKAQDAAKKGAKGAARKAEAQAKAAAKAAKRDEAKAERAARAAERKQKNAAAKARVAAAKTEKKSAPKAKAASSQERVQAKRSPKDLTDAQVQKARDMKAAGDSCKTIGLALGITPESAWRLTNPKKYAAQAKRAEETKPAPKAAKQTASVPKPARRAKK